MAAIHYTKKEFIKMIGELIEEDEHIIVSNEIDGTLEVLKKRKIRRIPFCMPNDAFKNEDGLKDMMYSRLLGVAIVPDANISEKLRHKNK